jgi:hypothetical protein
VAGERVGRVIELLVVVLPDIHYVWFGREEEVGRRRKSGRYLRKSDCSTDSRIIGDFVVKKREPVMNRKEFGDNL